jgi:DNA-binding LacI/PurR family transcriptional regulator
MATIRDVAADAGVARSTVSYVLSGKKKLPAVTVERVMASVTKLGYRPDPAARALALGRTNILGLLASVSPTSPEADVDIFMRFVRSAMYAARPRGVDVLVMGKGDDELSGDILADALVVMDVRTHDPRLPVLRERRVPTVLLGVPADTLGMSAVDLDFAGAARLMVDHLADLGHRQLAVLAPAPEPDGMQLSYRQLFREGFERQCAARGVTGRYVPSSDSGRPAVERWLRDVQDDLPQLTGVLVMDVASLDALLEITRERGSVAPRDHSIIALAPDEQLGRLYPDITLVDLPGGEMVARAVNQALDELAGAPAGGLELLPARLIDRGSAGPAGPGVAPVAPPR